MSKRKDPNQVLEQYSRGRLLSLLAEWVVNSLTDEDYAFDYDIRPTDEFDSPPADTPAPFYGQLKASHAITSRGLRSVLESIEWDAWPPHHIRSPVLLTE